MPQSKSYTAHRPLRLDCGHSVNAGESFIVTRVFSCAQEANWPLRILLACFAVIQQKRSGPRGLPAMHPQAQPQAQATGSKEKT
jgi:hypothetical protein